MFEQLAGKLRSTNKLLILRAIGKPRCYHIGLPQSTVLEDEGVRNTLRSDKLWKTAASGREMLLGIPREIGYHGSFSLG